MRPRLGRDIPLRLLLDTIISNRRGSIQSLFNILIGHLGFEYSSVSNFQLFISVCFWKLQKM